jgi:DNA-directed RNA polymerase II subunit RPB1
MLGFDPEWARPEWMIIKVYALAPPPVRPSVQAGDGVRSEDDLTYAYRMIVRTNNELKKYSEAGQ